jgi:lysozyme
MTKKKSNALSNAGWFVACLAMLGVGGMGAFVYFGNKPEPVIQPTEPGVIVVTATLEPTVEATTTPTATPIHPIRVSEKGKKFIAAMEGKSLVAYFDASNHCTIGYGHQVEEAWCYGELKITDSKADEWFDQDIKVSERFLAMEILDKNMAHVSINQCQYDALASFLFNMGGYYFRTSGILDAVKIRDYLAVPEILARYIYAGGGVPVDGLKVRRGAEARLFEECVYEFGE